MTVEARELRFDAGGGLVRDGGGGGGGCFGRSGGDMRGDEIGTLLLMLMFRFALAGGDLGFGVVERDWGCDGGLGRCGSFGGCRFA